MAMHFIHLGVNFKNVGTSTQQVEIEGALNGAKDWLRYAPNCWIIYTSKSPTQWYEVLNKIPWMSEQTYFLCVIELDGKSGWLMEASWSWLNKDRS